MKMCKIARQKVTCNETKQSLKLSRFCILSNHPNQVEENTFANNIKEFATLANLFKISKMSVKSL